MVIVLVVVVLLVIAAAAFLYARGRPGGVAGLRGGASAPTLRGSRGARVASRHDPMAVAVERHAQAIDPAEAAVEERNLQAQARSVAADLHARQAGQPDPHQAQVDAAAARTAADPYAQREPYVDPRIDADRAYAEPDPCADPVRDGGHVYPDPYAPPVDPDYPAQAPDPYARPVDADYPAPPPPRRRRRFL
jgi:hypothetical protein